MADYERSTQRTTLAGLPDALRDAIGAKADGLALTVAQDAPAFLTHSRRLRRVGLLARMGGGDRDAEHWTAMVLGARDLLVGTHGEHRGTAVLHCRLEDASTASLSRVREAAGLGDEDGMSVTGFPTAGADGAGTVAASFWVGLGPPAGDDARAALDAALRAAKA